jgi:limonene-1,2-epoxide hydrolase
MSTAEIKQTIEAMSDEERFFAASYLGVLIHRDDAEYLRVLGERMDRVAQGNKITLEQALKAHDALEAEGL